MSFLFSRTTVKQQLSVFSWLHPQHTTAPLHLNCCVLAAFLAIGSPTYWISYSLLLFHAWPWHFRKHLVCECVCADSAACHRVTWLLSCVFTDFRDFTCSAAGRLTGGWEVAGRIGELPIIWCCLSCIILSKGGKCWRIHEAEQLETEGDREEAALSVGVSMQNPDKASFSFFTQFVFARLTF